MEIIITGWALDSYLELKHNKSFSAEHYKTIIRPDVLLLKNSQLHRRQSFRAISFGRLLLSITAPQFPEASR